MKKSATFILIALAVAGMIAAILKTTGPESSTTNPKEAPELTESALPSDGVMVTYFTTSVRCASCRQIEKLTREAVESFEAKSGPPVLFRVINVEEPENKHYIVDYQLVSKTVVVSTRQGGQEVDWQVLQDVWLKLNDRPAFRAYVSSSIEASLERMQP